MTTFPFPGAEGSTVEVKSRYDNFIGGEWVAPVDGEYFENITPVTGKAFTEVARSKAADVEKALDAAQGQAEGAGDRADALERELARARSVIENANASQPPAAQPPAKPTAPSKAELLQPTTRLFGLYTTQSPFNWAEYDDVTSKVGVTPNVAGYFQGWDGAFRADAVTRSWAKGAMPMLTWESRPLKAANNETEDPAYSLPTILSGAYDEYLHQYARDIVALGLPLQLHAGFGDSDLRLHRADPALLTDWLRLTAGTVPVLLLHCWPYQRQAAYLATVFEQVHLDVGLALHYVGPARAGAVLAEAMEITPFRKLLYSSDAYGVAEFHLLGALSFRQGLAGVLQERVDADELSHADAVRIAAWTGRDNARRLYGLPVSDPGRD